MTKTVHLVAAELRRKLQEVSRKNLACRKMGHRDFLSFKWKWRWKPSCIQLRGARRLLPLSLRRRSFSID